MRESNDVLAIPVTKIINLFIKLSHFSKDHKVAKLKSSCKKSY